MIFVPLGKGLLSFLDSFMPSSVVEVLVVHDWFSLLVSVCALEEKGVVLADVSVNETTVALLWFAASEVGVVIVAVVGADDDGDDDDDDDDDDSPLLVLEVLAVVGLTPVIEERDSKVLMKLTLWLIFAQVR